MPALKCKHEMSRPTLVIEDVTCIEHTMFLELWRKHLKELKILPDDAQIGVLNNFIAISATLVEIRRRS